MSKAIAVSAEATAEATKQKEDEKEEKDGTKRHDTRADWLFLFDGDAVLADLDFDPGRGSALFVIEVAHDDDASSQQADNKIKRVAAHLDRP